MSNVEVDSRQVLRLFAELDSKRQKQVHRNALRQAANILVKETKRQLKSSLGKKASSKNWWNGKTLQSGIKSKVNYNATESKVHIMGDFRLRFFEMGTDPRKTTGKNTASVRGKIPIRRQRKPAKRGRIKSEWFFRTAKRIKGNEIESGLNRLIRQSIQRVYNKYK